MFKKTLVGSFLLLLSTLTFAQNKSVYTPLTDNKCKITPDLQIAGNMSGLCQGVANYKLQIAVDDERMSVSVIASAQKTFDLDFWGYFGNFSQIGEKAEWRMNGKTPVGLIVRYDVSDRGEGNKPTSYLMISKISSTESCVVAIVKPGKNQNAEARKLADSASNKPCQKVE
ncbi:MAG: hypothetical protein ABJA66_03630 [Actinomycetota bacterium]